MSSTLTHRRPEVLGPNSIFTGMALRRRSANDSLCDRSFCGARSCDSQLKYWEKRRVWTKLLNLLHVSFESRKLVDDDGTSLREASDVINRKSGTGKSLPRRRQDTLLPSCRQRSSRTFHAPLHVLITCLELNTCSPHSFSMSMLLLVTHVTVCALFTPPVSR